MPRAYELEIPERGIVGDPNWLTIAIGLAEMGIGPRELIEGVAEYPRTATDPWALMGNYCRSPEQVQRKLIRLFEP